MEQFDLDSIGTFIALGGSFSTHRRQDAEPEWPIMWTVPHQGIIPEGEAIEIPSYVEDVVPGPEPAVIIDDVGDGLWQATEEEAAAAVKGFTISNDVTAKGKFPAYPYPEQEGSLGRGYKSFPTFSPTLAGYEPLEADAIDNDTMVEAFIDGETVVSGSTDTMDFTVVELIAHVSKIINLQENDVISLGDPSQPTGYLDDAEEVTCKVEKIGELTNPIEHVD
ncbi:2-keto-4-pentenoate hydratase/2-oxohepta-3-ene-1,7-dioic acid hydratase (catechol pathway) [Halanaeroarchaeum sp. HSR-CO]|uniref:fumarylacetoacetate hydrolase family protein n=1 Tax=Halanaeroarchaeum sp. HSR-CO TaxID=2866382 RepID=UPI00217E8ED7|nr:fumarylacetoacetate hydrolase family protein [Halanaeroarchaeum sp. HSR-CO]UWG46326.1 2-keto-4-pentenoate hydratase/2-oxohepta-3-ene-1,7-dioic acid hydratase (catechol pathway) [Halanaeroarchaeum sp. HSR-CO]